MPSLRTTLVAAFASVAAPSVAACNVGSLWPEEPAPQDDSYPCADASTPHGSLSCSGTTIACDVGWGDCNGYFSDGCETSLVDDSANCGACGMACGNACAVGSCFGAQDVVVVPYTGYSASLAVGGATAYVANGSDIYSVSTSGGPALSIAPFDGSPFFADSDGAYWISVTAPNIELLGIGPSGGAPRVLSTSADDIIAIVGTDADNVYVSRNYGTCESISWIKKDGSAQGDIVCDASMCPEDQRSPDALPCAATSGASAFWLSSGALREITLPLGPPLDVADIFADDGIIVTGGAVYGVSATGVTRFDRATNAVTTLTTLAPESTIAVADDAAVYAASYDSNYASTIVRVTTDGVSTVLAGAQSGVSAMAIDSTYVYWLTAEPAGPFKGLALRRVRKSP